MVVNHFLGQIQHSVRMDKDLIGGWYAGGNILHFIYLGWSQYIWIYLIYSKTMKTKHFILGISPLQPTKNGCLKWKGHHKKSFPIVGKPFPMMFHEMYVCIYIYVYYMCIYIYIHIIYTHINTYIIPLYFPWYPQVGFSSIQELDQGNTKPWGHPTGNKKPWVSCRLHQAIDCGSYSHILGDIWWYLHYKPGHIPIYPVSNWSFQYLS